MNELQTGFLKINESEPYLTTFIGTFSNESGEQEVYFVAKSSKADIRLQLRNIGCSLSEINCYLPRIKNILNQFDESIDFPL